MAKSSVGISTFPVVPTQGGRREKIKLSLVNFFDNIASKDIRLALIKVNLISHDLGYLQVL